VLGRASAATTLDVYAGLHLHRGKAGVKWEECDFVFSGGFGLPVDPRTFNRAFARRCKLAGVRPITVHDAPRTCASLLVDLDVHPRVADA
jgi:integrase